MQAADDQHSEADFACVRHPRRRRAQQRRARAFNRRRAQRRAAGGGARARQAGSGALGPPALQARASVRHTQAHTANRLTPQCHTPTRHSLTASAQPSRLVHILHTLTIFAVQKVQNS